MNIIIPLGGKGERFIKKGYSQPKPLIKIFEKTMIEYVFDNLNIDNSDKVFIIYNSKLNNYDFINIIKLKYPCIHLIDIHDTRGATETIFLGLDFIFKNRIQFHKKSLIIDCDTFYTQDIRNIFDKSDNNMVFYTKTFNQEAIFSYIEMDDKSIITNIVEKNKISDNANTGAYAFIDINELYYYCKHILDNNILFNNEPYTSCVISEMIKSNILFYGYELNNDFVFSLGTPSIVENFIERTHAFLFDLDGTLVITDDIYFDVWSEILEKFNIFLNREIFSEFIQGNNDSYVLNTLLFNKNISLNDLSSLKDTLFIKNIDKIKVINGAIYLLKKLKLFGYKCCIVTNCNKNVANEIIKFIKIDKLIDFVISSNDCINGKPNSEPYQRAIEKYNIKNDKCFIFEDSKSGLLSGKGINPKLLIGIETIYNKNEIINYGCNFSIENFADLNLEILIKDERNELNYLKKIIRENSSINDVKEIIIDTNILKGGFIANVIAFKCITHYDEIYFNILKYENAKENNLSLMAKKLELYDREYYFYTEISKNINIHIPRFYNLVKDTNSKNCGIVLDNLSEKKYKINLNLNQHNINISFKIVDNIAKMHAKFWNKNLKKMFPNLKNSTDKTFYPFLQEFINEKYEIFKNKWLTNYNKNQIDLFDSIFNNFFAVQESFSKGENLTFIHGDIKSPNIFYDTDNNYEPYFIDWQHCAIGKGVQDLIFFIIESYDIINIKIIFNLLKNYYYLKLKEYGINTYSFEEYENDIFNAICYLPFFTSIWFGTIPQDELIDKNFPYFFINKMLYLVEYITNK